MADTLLRVEHLTMRFGGLVAVDDVSFAVERGTIAALIVWRALRYFPGRQ